MMRDLLNLLETAQIFLEDVCTIKTNFPEADFWMIRKGSANVVGKPVREFSPENIGIKVLRTDLLLPTFLFYAIENMVNQGVFAREATGSLRLVNIRTEMVRKIRIA